MDRSTLRPHIDREMPHLVAFRRDLHRHPELSYQERRTSARVHAELEALGIACRAGLAGGTGLIAHLPAATADHNDGAVALRADMDALPIEERTGREYASGTPGVMHACGHDGHTTILLGAARVLSRVERPRPVTLLFQPAEEGGAGADRLCREGALAGESGGGIGAPVSRIYGLHGWPQLPLGSVATRPGELLAATDDFVVAIRGVGGHAAFPHLARDPVLAGAHAVVMLQSIASRETSPLDAVVCTVARFTGGSASNIIPASVELEGTVRTLRASTRRDAKESFFRIVEGAAAAAGCRAEIRWDEGYPATINDAGLTERFFAVARSTLGPERVTLAPEPVMGGEDFSFYGRHVPACFFMLGLLPPGADPATTPKLHQAEFDFNDDALATGVEMMCRLALEG